MCGTNIKLKECKIEPKSDNEKCTPEEISVKHVCNFTLHILSE
jgi:hypothetical protein